MELFMDSLMFFNESCKESVKRFWKDFKLILRKNFFIKRIKCKLIIKMLITIYLPLNFFF